VADLAAGPPSVVELAVQDEASPDARTDPHAEQILEGPAGSALVLAENTHADIVPDPHFHLPELLGYERTELHAIREARNVRREQDRTCLRVDLPGCADPDAAKVGVRRAGRFERGPDSSHDGVDDVARVTRLGREHARAADDPLVAQDHRLDLRSSEVDAGGDLVRLAFRLRRRHVTATVVDTSPGGGR
jgi:hypothetical protein